MLMQRLPRTSVGRSDDSGGDQKSSLGPMTLQSSSVHDFHGVDLVRQTLTHNLAAHDRTSTLPASIRKSSPRPVGSLRAPDFGRSSEVSQDALSHGGPHGDLSSMNLLDLLKRLEDKVSSHYVGLDVSIAGSVKEVADVCTHIAGQCDGLVVRMQKLEDTIKDSRGLRGDSATERSNVIVGSRTSLPAVHVSDSEQRNVPVASQSSVLAENIEAWQNLLRGELAAQQAIFRGLVERVEQALRSSPVRAQDQSRRSVIERASASDERVQDQSSVSVTGGGSASDVRVQDRSRVSLIGRANASDVQVQDHLKETGIGRASALDSMFNESVSDTRSLTSRSRSMTSRNLKHSMVHAKRNILPRGVMKKPVAKWRPIRSQSTRSSGARMQPRRARLSMGHFTIRSPFPLMPDSVLATAFDLTGCLFLFLDSFVVPYQLAWGPYQSSVLLFLSGCAATFWTIDMFLHFATCIVEGGELITDLLEIICYYLKHSFILDLLLVTVEWMGLVFELVEKSSSVRNLSVLKVLRVLKVGRAVRLLRSGRLANIHELVMAKAERLGCVAIARLVVAIGQLIVFILWLSHVGACAWVSIQLNGWRDTASSWEAVIADQHKAGATSFAEAGLSDDFRYLMAYYWSLTTLFSGESFLDPMTTLETCFAISFVLFGVLFASGMISSMAAILVTSFEDNRELNHKLNQLCAFLRQRQIDRTLSLNIQHQVRNRAMAKSKLVENDIAVLSFLSAELKSKLQYSLKAHMFYVRPLWSACCFVDDQLIHNLCNLAVSTETCKPGHILFEEGEAVEHSYTIISGKMQYAQTMVTGSNLQTRQHSEGPPLLVAAGDNFCEIALWAHWETVGLMEAIIPCELLVFSCQGLVDVLAASNCEAEMVIRGYADAFPAFIDTENPSYLNDLSSTIDFDSVVAFMDQIPRTQMSMPGLTAYYEQTLFCDLGDSLRLEIQEGKCNLVIDESGTVLRVVRICVVHLRRPDGRLCVQIGTIERGVPIGRIELPGKKLRMQEALQTCMARIVDQVFHICRSNISVEEASLGREPSTSIHKNSRKFGLPTKYVRYAGRATLESCAELEIMHIQSCDDFAVECFALPDGEDSNVKKVFAWMTDHQYESMSNFPMSAEFEQLVTHWLAFFLPEGSRKSAPSET